MLSAVTGKAVLKVFTQSDIEIVTTHFNIREVKEYLPSFSAKYQIDETLLWLQLTMLPLRVFHVNCYKGKLALAKKYVAQRDADDVHLMALALKDQIPICSNDKDFDNLPLMVYPTGKLLALLRL